jgi:EAL domain-containing protein (putative c-di-GMP-specific phosphodiesterase class I)/GGDEF domain-containing protein
MQQYYDMQRYNKSGATAHESGEARESNDTGEPSDTGKVGEIDSEVERLEAENAELRRKLTEAEETTAWLEDLVNKNQHTLLPIRRQFDRAVAGLLDPERRYGHSGSVAVGVLRLDNSYDRIKDTRDRGKALLFNTADRLKGLLGEYLYQSDRLDEFLFALPGIPNIDAAELMATRIVDAVSRPHEPPAKDVVFGCHLGLSLNTGGLAKEELLGNAYIALAESESGRGRYVIYDETIGNRYRERAEIERSLSKVSQTGFEDFRLVYQPFIDRNGQLVGAEALIRWFHPQLGPLSPVLFIPIAEETGEIRLLGQWTLYNAARQLRDWAKTGRRDLHMSVNLSPAQFKQQDLVVRIEGILDALGLDGRHLKLELTEGAIMADPEAAIRTMKMLDERGVRISIDDFGTGYSSLSYLKRFPVHTLKIDRSFVEDVTTNQSNQEIVRAIIAMARSLRIESLAEGVETPEQRDFLIAEGCDSIQGYLYSPPVSARDFEPFLKSGRMNPRISGEQ